MIKNPEKFPEVMPDKTRMRTTCHRHMISVSKESTSLSNPQFKAIYDVLVPFGVTLFFVADLIKTQYYLTDFHYGEEMKGPGYDKDYLYGDKVWYKRGNIPDASIFAEYLSVVRSLPFVDKDKTELAFGSVLGSALKVKLLKGYTTISA